MRRSSMVDLKLNKHFLPNVFVHTKIPFSNLLKLFSLNILPKIEEDKIFFLLKQFSKLTEN